MVEPPELYFNVVGNSKVVKMLLDNDVLQCRKQLTLCTRYTHSVDCAAFCSNLSQVIHRSMQELASYAPIKVLPTSPMWANEESNQGIRLNSAPRAGKFNL